MRLGYDITIEQSQKLALTPGLIQAIKILQYNNQELTEYIEKELLENPMLEMNGTSEEFYFDRIKVDDNNLRTYLEEQIGVLKIDDKIKAMSVYLINDIDDNGYLISTVEEIASELNIDEDYINKGLEIIQGLEPAGVGARNLKECLTIQLNRLGKKGNDLTFLLLDRLHHIAKAKISDLSKEFKRSEDEVRSAVETIKKLDPKPGRSFQNSKTTSYVVPELMLEDEDGRLKASLKNKSRPRLNLASYHKNLKNYRKEDPELDEYLTEKLNSARWLIKSIEERDKTIEKVANCLVEMQEEFFKKGDRYLKVLTMKEVAKSLGIHESTVCRAVNGKFIETDKGVVELKSLFSSGVQSSEGSIASKGVQALIKKIVQDENPNNPHSDASIKSILESDGIIISRRTIAKYRSDIGIPSSSTRKRIMLSRA